MSYSVAAKRWTSREWRLRGGVLSVVLGCLLLSNPASQAQDKPAQIGYRTSSPFVTAGISYANVDWRGALDQLRSELTDQPDAQNFLAISLPQKVQRWSDRQFSALTKLNALTSSHFPAITNSSVPVLMPFDAGLFVADRTNGKSSHPYARFGGDFPKLEMFEAGPAGYDAAYTVAAGKSGTFPSRVFARPIEIQITGSLVTYTVTDAIGGKGTSVRALAERYPDIRRFVREGYVRYAFTRFGVPYVVSIPCLDSRPRRHILACREASPIAERFLMSLRIVGGQPAVTPPPVESRSVERPKAVSPDFTFHTPGEIITNTGYRKQGGLEDWTAYAQIRFPLEKAPAFANSQSFLNWGDCNHTGRSPVPRRKEQPYRCRVNDKPLIFYEKAEENYSYPWRDNFCETRDFQAGQCPGGYGHQGQDIRPSTCKLFNDGADRCIPNLHSIVAVRDGVVVRRRQQEALYLLVNEPTEHIRFRYLHMQPPVLDEDGLVYGRRVREGERIGVVSNFQDHLGGTTVHLHFDIQVFTPDGWIWVSPYITLVSSYERLLDARGREIVAVSSDESTVRQPTKPEAEEARASPSR